MKGWARVAALGLLAVLTITGCMPFPDDEESSVNGASFSNCGAAGGDATGIANVTPQMAANAKLIADYALANGFGKRGAWVGITSSWTESTLNEKAVHPSGRWVGLFQMSEAWVAGGEDRTNAAAMTQMFYQGSPYGHPGLDDIDGWEAMPVGQAAATVEGNLGKLTQYIGNEGIGAQITNAIVTSESCVPNAPGGPVQINKSQDPSSFGWQHNGPMEPLVFQGKNFGQVAAGTGPLWQGLLTDIVPHIPGGLNNFQGCYADRQNVNSPGRLSFHAYGLACDVNYNVNANGSDPAFLTGPHVIPIVQAQQAAAKWGMEWGGDWGFPDPMHFELHLSPEQVRQVLGTVSV